MLRRTLLALPCVPALASAETFKEAVERKQQRMEDERQLESVLRRQRAEERRERDRHRREVEPQWKERYGGSAESRGPRRDKP